MSTIPHHRCGPRTHAAGGRLHRGGPTIARILTSALALAVLLAAFLITLEGARTAEAGDGLLHLPGYGRWRVLSGYNTATHTGTDPYALDLVRDDAATAGTPLLAPVSGRIAWIGSNCIGLSDGRGATIHLCHVFPAADLDRRDQVLSGEVIGSVAPDGLAGNNGIAHVHMAIHVNGVTVPYSGVYALEGNLLPATTQWNAYYGNVFASSQGTSGGGTGGGSSAQGIAVDAGADFEVDQGATVTLSAIVEGGQEILEFDWTQTFGPPVQFSASGRSISFIAPYEQGATLQFSVVAQGAFGRTGSDTILLAITSDSVGPPPTVPAPIPPTDAWIVTGEVPDYGFGLVVFSGGSGLDLVAASGCPLQTARFWATVGGKFVVYIPGAKVAAANAAWLAAFPSGLPANTPLLGRCL